MALEHILEKIKEEVSVKVSEVDSLIEKRVEEIVRRGNEEVASLRENLLREAEGRIEEEKKSKLAVARLDFRKGLLQEKRVLLDEAFEVAFSDIRNSNHTELMKKLILQAAEGDGEVFVSGKDKGEITRVAIDEINKELHKTGKTVTLELARKNVDIDGGFILKMRKIEVNCSFDSIFKKKKEELELEVSGIIFENDELPASAKIKK